MASAEKKRPTSAPGATAKTVAPLDRDDVDILLCALIGRTRGDFDPDFVAAEIAEDWKSVVVTLCTTDADELEPYINAPGSVSCQQDFTAGLTKFHFAIPDAYALDVARVMHKDISAISLALKIVLSREASIPHIKLNQYLANVQDDWSKSEATVPVSKKQHEEDQGEPSADSVPASAE